MSSPKEIQRKIEDFRLQQIALCELQNHLPMSKTIFIYLKVLGIERVYNFTHLKSSAHIRYGPLGTHPERSTSKIIFQVFSLEFPQMSYVKENPQENGRFPTPKNRLRQLQGSFRTKFFKIFISRFHFENLQVIWFRSGSPHRGVRVVPFDLMEHFVKIYFLNFGSVEGKTALSYYWYYQSGSIWLNLHFTQCKFQMRF